MLGLRVLLSQLPRTALLAQERDQAVQKRAYKALAFICSARHDFTGPHLKEVLETLLAGVTSSLSAAKRYRLQCLQVAPAPTSPRSPPCINPSCGAQPSLHSCTRVCYDEAV